jgi:DNA-binding CsgD family transcriptional regulator
LTQHAATSPRLVLDPPTRQLIDAIEADPLAPVTAGIPAPGGYGKTTVLAELARVYAAAGVPVLDIADVSAASGATLGAAVPGAASRAAVPGADGALLVDDAQLLGPAQLGELAAIVGSGRARVVVAYRPWPRSAALADLADALGRAGAQVSLAPWDRDQIATHLADRLNVTQSMIDFTHVQTGGVPRFVGHIADALARGAGWLEQPDPQVPRSVLDALRADLDRLDAEVERFLLAVEAGVGRQVELLGALLGRDGDALTEMMDAARATGLLGADGGLLPLARRAVAVLVPAERRIGIRQRLAEIQHERGGPVLDLARALLGTGVGGAGVAAVFQAAAGEALSARPALAAKLFAAAAAAGTPVAGVATGWARASARSGDLDRALRLADQTIATEQAPPADRAEAAEIAAAALAHRGQLGRSAELYRWAGPGFPAAFAMIGLLGTGQVDRVPAADPAGSPAGQSPQVPGSPTSLVAGSPAGSPTSLVAGSPAGSPTSLAGLPTFLAGPPTLLAGAATLMAQGIHESITGSTTTALAQLVRASALLEPAGHGLLLPDSPAALAALVGVHSGELALAESVLDRATMANLGGSLLAARHRLLAAWIAMARGRMTVAREHLVLATRSVRVLEPRDWLFAVALDVGLARRNSDLATLRRTWSQACEAVMRHPVDLFTVLPLGEFAVAAARLRDQARLRPHLDEAWNLLAALGSPPLWTTPLHWSALHAAIIAEQPTAAAEHAEALAGNAAHCAYCAVLASAAACWLAVVAGEVDAPAVEASARALHEAGLCWDGARLAGQAAIRTSDRRAMVSLLNCARVLQGRPTRPAAAAPPPPKAAEPAARNHDVLSEREREVAALVLAGLTYKQVGDRLFISAKTVEHHVARMRQKLGATSRAELFDQLRQLIRS